MRHGDDLEFYRKQAADTVRWLEDSGILPRPGRRVLDLACGHGEIGLALAARGCEVTFADIENSMSPEHSTVDYRTFDVMEDDYGELGRYELVICSNLLEHIPSPRHVLSNIDRLLNPGGLVYLSWVNWLSPWGGHEFSPFHYLGARLGPRLYDMLTGRPRKHVPGVSLFRTSIHQVLRAAREDSGLRVVTVVPRYMPELAFITRLPGLRELLTFNCLLVLAKAVKPEKARPSV